MLRRVCQEVISACYKAVGAAVITEAAHLMDQLWTHIGGK